MMTGLQGQWEAAVAAPFVFIAAVGAAVIAIWGLLSWRYGGIIANLEARLAAKTEEVARLEKRAQQPAPAESASAPTRRSALNRSDPDKTLRRHRAIGAMTNAIEQMPVAHEKYRVADWERVSPQIRAAMLSLKKEYGIPIIPHIDDLPREAETARRFWRDVMPYLKEDHDAEAYATAISFLQKFGFSPKTDAPGRTVII